MGKISFAPVLNITILLRNGQAPVARHLWGFMTIFRWNDRRILAAMMVLGIALGMSDPALAGKRVALVVGVSTYSAVPSLPNPASDARSVAQSLRAVDFEVTELTTAQQLDRASLSTALLAFRRSASGAEAAVIYFAGHGVEVNGRNWLLPSDARAETPDELEVTAIPSSVLVNAVSGANTVRLVILDACRDNPFVNLAGWSSGGRSIGATRGLAREGGLPPNVVVLMATQPGTKASDGPSSANSPFARALSASLTSDSMRLYALPTSIARQMRQLTGIDQRPDLQGIFDEPDWMFRPSANPGPAGGIIIPTPTSPTEALVAECLRLTPLLKDTLSVLAVPACTKAAQAAPGRADVQLSLGRAYEKAENYAEARRWYEQSALQGNAVAMNNLGGLYHNGNGVVQSYPVAREWYLKSAAQGDEVAMLNLGVLYRFGQGVTRDYAEAKRWFEKAAALGVEDAMGRIGDLYVEGLGVRQDYAEARRWYVQAAAKGYADAMVDLSNLYADGNGVPQDYAEARRWADKAVALGNARAMGRIGYMYFKGRGVPQDYVEARRWYEKAAAGGNDWSMNALGDLYYEGQGVTRDYGEARRWYELAAAKGNAYGMSNLGYLYRNGLGVAMDYTQARHWYEKGAAADDANSMYSLGLLYLEGRGVTRDLSTARRWFEQAAAKGYANAKTELAKLPS